MKNIYILHFHLTASVNGGFINNLLIIVVVNNSYCYFAFVLINY